MKISAAGIFLILHAGCRKTRMKYKTDAAQPGYPIAKNPHNLDNAQQRISTEKNPHNLDNAR